MKRIGMCVVVLLVVGVFAATARAQLLPECQNLPTSAGPVPQPCADMLLEHTSKATDLETNVAPLATDRAFGPEFTTGDLVSLVLNTPETLNEIGPTIGPNGQDVGACDFANTATFTNLFALERLTAATLFTLDTSTGAVTPIGPTVAFGPEEFAGLGTDPTDGTLYASSTDLTTSSLYTINPVTGTATRIGRITRSPASIAIAFDPVGQLFGYDISNDSLMSINKSTGAGTIIGPLGFDANFAQGMDFDEIDGTCYLFAFNADTGRGELRKCDTATGATILVGVLGATTPGGLLGLGCAGIATGVAPFSETLSVTTTVAFVRNEVRSSENNTFEVNLLQTDPAVQGDATSGQCTLTGSPVDGATNVGNCRWIIFTDRGLDYLRLSFNFLSSGTRGNWGQSVLLNTRGIGQFVRFWRPQADILVGAARGEVRYLQIVE